MPPRQGNTATENEAVSRLFRTYADLLAIDGANPYRVRAYRNAARVLDGAGPVAGRTPAELARLPGIGMDLAAKITEVARTGRLRGLVDLERRLPASLVPLLRLPGLGPRRVRMLFEQLGIETAAELREALARGAVARLAGFGRRVAARLAREVGTGRDDTHRVPRCTVAAEAEALLRTLQSVPGVQQAALAGSWRRGRATVGDLDVIVAASQPGRVVERFVGYPGSTDVTAGGATRAAIVLASGLPADLRVLSPESFGAGLHYFTGSQAHTIQVRRLARGRGLKLNEYGLWDGDRRLAGRTEAGVFRALRLPFIPPELREGRGEVEAALAGTLPRLLETRHLRGDLHCHTRASDGRDNLSAMARAAEALGYEYLAITDHSPAAGVARGLDREGLRRQRRAIDRLNGEGRRVQLLAGTEVDILPDGRLGMDDESLGALDVVVASVHSAFDLPRARQTQRLLRALRHPAVDILGHPTGRMFGRRPAMALDLELVARAAAEAGVFLEVSAMPARLDLDDMGVSAARCAGAGLVVSSDAHAAAELARMDWGVTQARQGWTTADEVANTRPLADLLSRLHRARQPRQAGRRAAPAAASAPPPPRSARATRATGPARRSPRR